MTTDELRNNNYAQRHDNIVIIEKAEGRSYKRRVEWGDEDIEEEKRCNKELTTKTKQKVHEMNKKKP